MRKFDRILKTINEIYVELIHIRSEVEKDIYYLSLKDRDDILEKHIELATCFGIFENALNSRINID